MGTGTGPWFYLRKQPWRHMRSHLLP